MERATEKIKNTFRHKKSSESQAGTENKNQNFQTPAHQGNSGSTAGSV
jgi:hypothetical protein